MTETSNFREQGLLHNAISLQAAKMNQDGLAPVYWGAQRSDYQFQPTEVLPVISGPVVGEKLSLRKFLSVLVWAISFAKNKFRPHHLTTHLPVVS